MGLLSLFPEGGSFLLGGRRPDSPRSRESVACGQTTLSSPFLGEDWWQRGLFSYTPLMTVTHGTLHLCQRFLFWSSRDALPCAGITGRCPVYMGS